MSLKFKRKGKNGAYNNISGSRIEDHNMILKDQYDDISFDRISICDLQSTCRSLAWAISWEIQSQIHFGYFQSWFVQTCSALKNDFNASCFVIWISYWIFFVSFLGILVRLLTYLVNRKWQYGCYILRYTNSTLYWFAHRIWATPFFIFSNLVGQCRLS